MLIRTVAAFATFALAAMSPAFASENLDAVVTTAMTGSKVPAVGIVVMRDGKITGQAVHGLKRIDRQAPVGADDVWLIGSTGKVMTVAMVARLVERGVLSWDAPLEDMLPDLAQDMRPEYRKVTLVQLLSHQAGLPRDLKNLRSAEKSSFTESQPFPQQRLSYIAKALKDKPNAVSGTAFGYSNTGFLVAAVIAERVTGDSYENLMRKEVFEPLGMRKVGFGNTHDGQNRGHRGGKPTLTMRKFDDGAPPMFGPAGFLHMSLDDWARFNLDQLAGNKGQGKLLTPASYRLMQTAQAGRPAGLDWGVQASIAGRQGPVLVHQGSDGNWLAMAVLFPEQGTGILAVANAGPDMGADKVLTTVLGTLFPALSPARQAVE